MFKSAPLPDSPGRLVYTITDSGLSARFLGKRLSLSLSGKVNQSEENFLLTYWRLEASLGFGEIHSP